MAAGVGSDLAVVVGSQDAGSTAHACLEAMSGQVSRHGGRIVVVDGSSDDTADRLEERFPGVEVVRADPRLLMPELWKLGLDRVDLEGTRLVALANAQCVPAAGWIEALIDAAAERPAAAGVGGPIAGPEAAASALSWALYFARYCSYMPPVEAGPVSEIPGDNALYRTAALVAAWSDRAAGFWEVLVHRRLRETGAELVMAPSAAVSLGPAVGPWRLAAARFRHGRHYGATRPVGSGLPRLLRAATAPLLPALLVARIGRRVRGRRPDLMRHYLRSLPWLALLIIAWSLGEAAGYLRPR